MNVGTSEDDALDELLEAIYRNFHYDFRSYTRASLERGVARAKSSLNTPLTKDLLARIQTEPDVFSKLVRHLTISVSDLFRDPSYYQSLRKLVIPHLASYASPRIWVAGCGKGEEAYSIAIILEEEGILDRSLIYATDIDESSLEVAAAGAYPTDRAIGFSQNYLDAGGTKVLDSYYESSTSQFKFADRLRRRITFSDHSLATDAVFAEVQLVSCRNVLIYFDQTLQDRAIGLFRDSLCARGFLGLGPRETLVFSAHTSAFEPLSDVDRIYRLRQGQEAKRLTG